MTIHDEGDQPSKVLANYLTRLSVAQVLTDLGDASGWMNGVADSRAADPIRPVRPILIGALQASAGIVFYRPGIDDHHYGGGMAIQE